VSRPWPSQRTRRPSLILDETRTIPTHWYTCVPDLPHSGRRRCSPWDGPADRPADLSRRCPGWPLIGQEVSQDQDHRDSGQVATSTASGARPRVFRARRFFERALDTTLTSYYKLRGHQPGRQHKPNTASPRPTTTKRRIRRLTTETGAGQWGSALAFACALFGSSARCIWSAPVSPESLTAIDDPSCTALKFFPSPSARTNRARRAGRPPGLRQAAWHCHLRSGRGRRDPR